MTKNVKPKKSYHNRIEQFLFPALIVSLLINVLFFLRAVPIDSVEVGCSLRTEIRLSLLSGDSERMKQAKVTAARLKEKKNLENSRNDTDPYGNTIAEGVSACDGVTYRLYIL